MKNLIIRKSVILNYCFILIVMFLEVNLLRIFDMSIIPGYGENVRMFTIQISLFMIYWMIIIKQNSLRKIISNYRYVIKLIIIFLIFILIEGMYSMLLYNQSLFNVWWASYYFLSIIIILPFLDLVEKDNDVDKILNIINILIFLFIVITLIQSLIYNYLGHEILIFDSKGIRNGRVRIWLGSTIGLFTSYNMYCFMQKRKGKIFNLISLIMAIFALFYCEMTRGNEIAVIISIILMYFLSKKLDIKKFFVIVISIIVLVYCINNRIFSSFFSTLFQNSNSDMYTTGYRINSMTYFFDFWKNSPIFGMGFILPNRADLVNILYGPTGICYYDDIGVLGFLFHFGVGGIIIISITLGRMIYILVKNINIQYKHKPLLIGLLSYYIMTIPSLSIYDPQRIVMLPICLGIFEFVNRNIKVKYMKGENI